jgi:HAD superfamily hydrolase (TIGR01549 family)
VKLTAIFFDAGNTLVFPDLNRTLAPLHARGIRPRDDQLLAAERIARRRRDDAAANGAVKLGDREYWEAYYDELLRNFGITDAELRHSLIDEARRSANWEYVLPGTREALLTLKQRYQLGLISNSDGHIDQLFGRLGLQDCFDTFADSGRIGYEKPDARIFHAAVASLNAIPAKSLYVGDIYSIDYLGAIGAGMQPMLFDRCGVYRESGLPSVQSLDELVAKLC